MKTIQLTRGYEAIVDDEDYDLASRYKWHVQECWKKDRFGTLRLRRCYAKRQIQLPHGKQRKLTMHNFITGYAFCDHIDGNGLNNSRSNIRESNHKENTGSYRNRIAPKTSRYRGVSLHGLSKKFAATMMTLGGKQKHLGLFESELKAAIRRDIFAIANGYNLEGLNFNWRKILSLKQ